MAQKRLWSSLADSTKQRYKRNGVTPQMYNSTRLRKDNAGLFQQARGHRPESYRVGLARAYGVDTAAPGFDKLPRKMQEAFADAYMDGILQKNVPFRRTANGGMDWALMATDAKTGEFTGKPKAFDDTVMSRFHLESLMDELGKTGGLSAEDWVTFKALYNSHF